MLCNQISLRTNAESFVVYKKSLGYVYETQSYCLMHYVSFAEKTSDNCSIPDKSSILAFIDTMSDAPGTLYNCVAVLREFSRYLQLQGFSNAFIVPANKNPQIHPEPPYFFNRMEINMVFAECDSVKPHDSFQGREIVLPAMFRLVYCCGLRCKETTTLLCKNVDIEYKYMDIIQSKGLKSRRIFISEELSAYLKEYEITISQVFPYRKYFFPYRVDGHYSSGMLNRNFHKFWFQAFPDFNSDIIPTVYDFRHHFAYYNLNKWAREGLDVNIMLPYLMRYMGHNSIKSTLYYFHFVPEFFPTYQEMSLFSEDIIPEVPYEE
ncbi:site-specific recombinase XerD [Ruminiclostridium sufflavum DSM 19573]|uniref:Site-specific recombinase XerD n=1 Tax=Ruminiclostridium sufflavum DSM 19573 TaxID=1121337 RepID=A0A318XHU8_9FIRM|nr:tyrosine-type recombinase/integrase [Ruminiclostridium sufflavum]PYG84933.1 site-specific recombinase XerD [Ruminiclostridium sufflavum DSM 19573]